MNRYLLECSLGAFMIVMEGPLEEYFIIDMSCSYKMVPQTIKQEGNQIVFITASFMDANLHETLFLQEQDEKLLCEGVLADYGDVSGIAHTYDGLTPYEEMLEGLKIRKKPGISRRTEEEIRGKVEDLLSRMTLKEKIGQMSQSAGEDVSEIGSKIEGKSMIEQIKEGEVGSIIYIGYSPEAVFAYQKYAVEETRLGIPLLVCQDVVHGFQTIFPIPLAQSCSFDPELIQKSASIAAKEAASAGIMCAYAPMLDLSRDPRWGRVCEGTGEDSYLGGRIAEAIVKGYQGQDLGDLDTVAACLKHFVGYSACEGGRDYNTTEISDYSLMNMYIPAFEKGVQAGAAMVMSAFTFLNGRPVTANREILHDLLREQIGFDGVVITDYAAVKEVGIHGCGKDWEDVTKKVINATVDMEMATSYYNYYLEKLVEKKQVTEKMIDDAVRRILILKYQLGIMDDPYRYIQPEIAEQIIYSEEHLAATEKMAEESMVLLKNNGILPLDTSKSIALIGPFADAKDMLGAWQFSNYNDKAITIKEGLEQEGFTVRYEQGCAWNCEITGGIEKAMKVADQSDVIVVALGEISGTTGEATSKCNLELPSAQIALLNSLKRLEKPVIVTLTNGRPLLLNAVDKQSDAVLETWFLGAMAGRVIAGAMSGRVNPSGKLSMSFPANIGQIPVYYNHYNTGRPYDGSDERFASRYLDAPNEPLYSFGYGLTYGEAKVTDIQLNRNQIFGDEKIKILVNLENNTNKSCTEVVQMYICNTNGTYVRPVKELKGFKRIFIESSCKADVEFEIGKEEVRYYDPKGKSIVETGSYQVMIGLSSRDCDLIAKNFRFLCEE